MTRDELESLGHTDAELERWHHEYFDSNLELTVGAEDTWLKQFRRRSAFDQVMAQWQGVSPPDPNSKPIGAYAHTDAEEHEKHRNGSST
jgi:hypothetical protein